MCCLHFQLFLIGCPCNHPYSNRTFFAAINLHSTCTLYLVNSFPYPPPPHTHTHTHTHTHSLTERRSAPHRCHPPCHLIGRSTRRAVATSTITIPPRVSLHGHAHLRLLTAQQRIPNHSWRYVHTVIISQA